MAAPAQPQPVPTAGAATPASSGCGWRPLKPSIRAPLAVGALAAVVLCLFFGASAAQAAVRIVAPADEALVPTAKVRVALAARGARSLRVSLDGRDITRRLRARGDLRAGVLRGPLVRPAAHWLHVRWRPAGGGKERTLARRFLVARRARSLARPLFPRRRLHSAAGVVRLRLAVARGVGLLRVRVNGRAVPVRHLGRLWPRVSLTLGARHGLRFGRNRVRVLLHHFGRARYDVEAFTVVLRRSRPLAAGIAEYRGEAGGRAVRLDGRARATRPGRRLRYRWRIIRRPRGSRARLLNRFSARPRLPIDVRGRYRLKLRVSERPGRRTTSHRLTVLGDTNALPIGASLKIDLSGARRGARAGAITIDDAPSLDLPPTDCAAPSPRSGPRHCVYPTPNVDFFPYLLILDALTLEPKAPIKSLDGYQTDAGLRDLLRPWTGENVIAILVNGAAAHFDAPPKLADFEKPSAYIFTPIASPDLGIRSGWYSEASTEDNYAEAEVSGFFQKSWPVGSKRASDQYRFVPGNYVSFDTSRGGDPAGQNTMVVGGKEYTSRLPGGAADGFQVLVLDKTLKPMLATPTTFANGAPIGDMATLLHRARTTPGVSTVFVQSIGRPNPYSVSANDAWNNAAQQLEGFGANTDVFLNLRGPDWPRPKGTTGWYSFVAGLDPGCAGSSDRCQAAIEASTPLTERSGDLSGVLGRNRTWQYAPVVDEVGGDEHTGEMLTLAYRPPSKWPFSGDPAARRVLHYLATFNDGARDLRPLGAANCYDPGPIKDVRSSYCGITTNWATIHADLGDSKAKGGQGEGVCGDYPGTDPKTGVPVDKQTYGAICDQIAKETAQLSHVSDRGMDRLKSQIGSDAAITAYFTVQEMAKQVKAAVEAGPAKANRSTTAEVLELMTKLVELSSMFLPEPVGAVYEFTVGALALTGEITSLAEGDKQGESALGKPVTLDPARLGLEIEQRLGAAGAAFDHSWDMLVSDPAKLNAAYENFALDRSAPGCERPGATCGIWKGVPDDLDSARPMMQNGVRHWAAGKFMAATYDVWLVDTLQIAGPQAREVTPADLHTIGCDRVDNFGNTSTWPPFYQADDPKKRGDAHPTNVVPQDAAYYLRDRVGLTQPKRPNPVPRHGSNMWVLAQGDISDKGGWPKALPAGARYWPPASLLADLYAPPNETSVGGGYGWERPWLYSRGQHFTIHGSGWMRDHGCEWFRPDRVPWLL
jgi:hypothetical protein